MADYRDHPYSQFKFLVDFGDNNTGAAQAGFQEISRIGKNVTDDESRNENEKGNSLRKITGLNKATDVTMKRGVIHAVDLYNRLDQIRNGDQSAYRTVTIRLQNEDHTAIVHTRRLLQARIIEHVSGPMNAKGTDVAIEEWTISYERLEVE